jgi:hypothetical protein
MGDNESRKLNQIVRDVQGQKDWMKKKNEIKCARVVVVFLLILLRPTEKEKTKMRVAVGRTGKDRLLADPCNACSLWFRIESI